MSVGVRSATADDAPAVLALIRGLAAYEREPDAVETTEEVLRAQLSESPPPFQCLLAEREGRTIGFALWFFTYSTWRGKRGVWLEDLFVLPDERRRGAGRALLAAVAQAAVRERCARLELSVLDCNEPAIAFYRSLGSRPMAEWTTHRWEGEALGRLAEEA